MARGEYTPPLPEPVQIAPPPPEPERTESGRLVYAERKKLLRQPAGWKGESMLPIADIAGSQGPLTSETPTLENTNDDSETSVVEDAGGMRDFNRSGYARN